MNGSEPGPRRVTNGAGRKYWGRGGGGKLFLFWGVELDLHGLDIYIYIYLGVGGKAVCIFGELNWTPVGWTTYFIFWERWGKPFFGVIGPPPPRKNGAIGFLLLVASR